MIPLGMAERDSLKVTLRYRGASVDDGTMPIADVMAALHGFAGAYGKIAARETPEVQHELRIAAVRSHSFDLVIFAATVLLKDPSLQQQLIEISTDAAKGVLRLLAWLIRARQHTKGQPSTINIEGDGNTVLVTNAEGAKLSMPTSVAELLEKKLVDSELGKIVSPLRKGEIDSAELSVEDAEDIAARIESEEREYFETTEIAVTTTKPAEIEGYLVSLNKERNRGRFRLQDGTGVPYIYAGDQPVSFHQDFAYKGPVKVTCQATLDGNLHPTRLDITAVEKLQKTLPFHDDSSSSSDQT